MDMLRYNIDVEWSLPLLFDNDLMLISMLDIFKFYNIPYNFRVFGAVRSKWSGGRPSKVRTQDKGYVTRLLSHLVANDVTPALTLSNCGITKDDLKDSFCNFLLDLGYELGCDFIIASDLLYEHIKNKYPDASCVASVIKPTHKFQAPGKINSYDSEEELNYYNELIDKYEKVVVRPEYAINSLEAHKDRIKDMSKIEVLVNQSCKPDCPLAIEHYQYHEKMEITETITLPPFLCFKDRVNMTCEEAVKSSLMMTQEQIDNLVENVGVKKLKLQGRSMNLNYNIILFSTISAYVFKPVGFYQLILGSIVENLEEAEKFYKEKIFIQK